MTAEAFAELLNARRIGPGKWMARCPGHDDRSPSLSIRQGNRGVLLRCWSAACAPEAICKAIGIRVADLFDGPPTSPEQIANLNRQREVHAVMERGLRLRDRERRHDLWRYEKLRDALGAKLLRDPDDAELGRLFHQVCDHIRETTPLVYPEHEDGPRRSEPAPETSAWIHAELSEIAGSFSCKDAAPWCAAA